jgi:hypothetical protein
MNVFFQLRLFSLNGVHFRLSLLLHQIKQPESPQHIDRRPRQRLAHPQRSLKRNPDPKKHPQSLDYAAALTAGPVEWRSSRSRWSTQSCIFCTMNLRNEIAARQASHTTPNATYAVESQYLRALSTA